MKLSVITPSFNQGVFLPETLRSVRDAAEFARGHEVEHFVVDGGSTDGTPDVLRGQTFARWISEPDGGQAAAINRGMRETAGDVMAWLCSDDLYEPNTLRRVLDAFARNPQVDVVYGDYFFLEGDTGWKRPKVAGPWSYARLLRGNFISQPATFWRRRVFEKFGGLDESLRYCLDHEYWLRIARDTRWLYLPERLAVMRLHADSKTCSQLAPMWWESARMQSRHGVGMRPWLAALAMQIYGQHYYRMKRLWFRRVGRGRAGVS